MNTILLANLIKIRWLAIIGQFVTLILVKIIFDFNIALNLCLVVVFLSVIINIFSYSIIDFYSTLENIDILKYKKI